MTTATDRLVPAVCSPLSCHRRCSFGVSAWHLLKDRRPARPSRVSDLAKVPSSWERRHRRTMFFGDNQRDHGAPATDEDVCKASTPRTCDFCCSLSNLSGTDLPDPAPTCSRCCGQQLGRVGAGHQPIQPRRCQVRSRNYKPSVVTYWTSGSCGMWHLMLPPVGSGLAHARRRMEQSACSCGLPCQSHFLSSQHDWLISREWAASRGSSTAAQDLQAVSHIDRLRRDNARRLTHLRVLPRSTSGSWPALPRRGETTSRRPTESVSRRPVPRFY